MDKRSEILLKALIEHYIADGQPVGSRSLSKFSGLDLSPASVRNIMSDLEDAGLVASRHTSSGRVPTDLGYRLFVDSLLSLQPLEAEQCSSIAEAMQLQPTEQLLNTTSQLLSELTSFAGIVVLPQKSLAKIRQLEFIKLSENRLLLILVTLDGEVQNRIIHSEISYSHEQLIRAAQYLNEHCCGLDLEQIQQKLAHDIHRLSSDMKPLWEGTLAFSNTALNVKPKIVIHGEKNFLNIDDFAKNMEKLRQLFELFEQQILLMNLLDNSTKADGVKIFIGQESGINSLFDCSVVVASYQNDGQVLGTLGVIGPTRMAYNHVISVVDITSKLLSQAMTLQKI